MLSSSFPLDGCPAA